MTKRRRNGRKTAAMSTSRIELGFQRVKHGGVRGYIVVCRSGDEMQAAQRSMAAEASADEGTVDSKDTIF